MAARWNGQFFDRSGSTISKPVVIIVSRRDAFSAHVATEFVKPGMFTSWRYVRIARRLLGRKSLDLTTKRPFGRSARDFGLTWIDI